MYINEFWCGVIATIIAEIIASIGLVIWAFKETDANKKQDDISKE